MLTDKECYNFYNKVVEGERGSPGRERKIQAFLGKIDASEKATVQKRIAPIQDEMDKAFKDSQWFYWADFLRKDPRVDGWNKQCEAIEKEEASKHRRLFNIVTSGWDGEHPKGKK